MKTVRTFLFMLLSFVCIAGISVPSVAYADSAGRIKYPAYMTGIDYGKTVTYVVGHKPPDSDTVFSAIAYANLKRKLGVNAKAVITAPPNAESAFALKYFGVATPSLLENAAGKNIILVDHNSFAQAAPGMNKANILEVIDHHNAIGDVKTAAPVYYRNMPVGCAATIVWMAYLESKVAIDKPMAGIMLSAILSDTDNLQSSATTELDRQAVRHLQKIARVKDRTGYFLAMEKEFAAYKNMSERDIFYSDYKEFKVNGISYGCATVVALTKEERLALEKRLYDWMAANYKNQKMDMLFLKIHDLETYTADLVFFGEGAGECIRTAFGEVNGNAFALEKNISRKIVVRALQPAIEEWSSANRYRKAA